MSNMQYSASPLIGGTNGVIGGKDGTQFNDITKLSSDGSNAINPNSPFASIEVYHGEVIDGIAPKYNLKSGDTKTIQHGSGGAGRNTSTVTLYSGEVIVGIYGKAGSSSGFGRNLIITMAFVIYNANSGTLRTEGPFGDMYHSNDGRPYYASNPSAFGGYANDAMAALGLGGLIVYNMKADGQN